VKYLRTFLAITSLLLLFAAVSRADTVTGSGTWGSETPTTTESAAGDTWYFSFQVSDPVTDASGSGGVFSTEEFSDFVYLLNGVAITPTLTAITFYDEASFGLFDLDLSDGNIVSLYGDQVYAGTPPPDMTLVGGVYSAGIAMNDSDLPDGSGSGTVKIATTPEPGTLALLGLGSMVVAFRRKKMGLA